jgi:hypothetical protein
VAGPFAMVIRGLSGSEREVIRDKLAEAFAPFAVGESYELPGLGLTAVAH